MSLGVSSCLMPNNKIIQVLVLVIALLNIKITLLA